jgi:hypothetical protein
VASGLNTSIYWIFARWAELQLITALQILPHTSGLLITRQFFTVIITVTQLSSSRKLTPYLELTSFVSGFIWNSPEAEAYCRQSAGTVITGIEPRWDPWP